MFQMLRNFKCITIHHHEMVLLFFPFTDKKNLKEVKKVMSSGFNNLVSLLQQWQKKNETLPFAATWMDLENIILSEISQRKTNTIPYHLYVEPKK